MTTPNTVDPANADATAALWGEFATRLRAFVAARVAHPDDVDDIVQSVFLKAHLHLDTVRDHSKVTAWLYQIARNAITDHYRTTPRRREQPAELLDDQPGGLSPDAVAEDQNAVRGELSDCVQPLLARMDPTSRQALELTDLGGMRQTAAAEQLGISVSGMKSRVQRARAQLNELIHQACQLELDARGGPVSCEPTEDRC